jgi:hypothetical protein
MPDEEKGKLVLEADLDRGALTKLLVEGEIVAMWELMDDVDVILSIKTDLTANREELEALLGKEVNST